LNAESAEKKRERRERIERFSALSLFELCALCVELLFSNAHRIQRSGIRLLRVQLKDGRYEVHFALITEAQMVALAEVVAQDRKAADQFRDYLEGLQYEVQVTDKASPDPAPDLKVVVYHVSPNAALAERRARPRPRAAGASAPHFWLEVVQFLRERRPDVPLLVAVPDVQNVADKALDAGATDVTGNTVTAKVFGR
jgi:hypothetical protein